MLDKKAHPKYKAILIKTNHSPLTNFSTLESNNVIRQMPTQNNNITNIYS